MPIPEKAKIILDFIGEREAPDGFNQYYSGIRREDAPPKPLTKMTVQEVLDWQDAIDPKYRSEAVGRFQIMEDTLRDLVKSGQIDANALFDEETQYKIGYILLRRRGFDDWIKGKISDVEFGNRLAAEWAALPMLSGDKINRSYYDGDGLNSALATADQVRTMLRGASNGTGIAYLKDRKRLSLIKPSQSKVRVGDLVQITNRSHKWFPCVLCADSVEDDDILAVLAYPVPKDAVSFLYIRLKHSDYMVVGRANIVYP